MWLLLCFCFTVTVFGQLPANTNYQQCAANLACSINYEKTFQEKLNNLGYHTTLQIQSLKQSINSQVTPLTQDLEILKTNATAIQDEVTRELQLVFRGLDHDRAFLHNLSVGVYNLAKELHHEQYVRFQDVHKIIEEVNLVKQALGMMNNHSDLLQAASCEVQLNATIHNATFYESQYRKVLSMYHNLQSTVHDVRQQQQMLLTQLQEKTREAMRLQKQSPLSSPPPAAKLSSRSANCGAALGMEDGTILDAFVSSSQSFGDFSAGNTRLNHARGWYTGAKTTSKDWVQINLNSSHVITALATQGAPCCEVWVTNFTVYYSNDGNHWHQHKTGCNSQNLVGNTDQTTIKYQTLDPPMVAKYVRINIIDFHKKNNSNSNYIGMRTELYGCHVTVPKITQPH
ncbi:uncharacterized protein [Mytilus edulis]|uniref:uncharacterized protein isoform X1 n=1 Tax=Mytilus edulis TaxID=6550 RepID=UPI0039EEE65D